MSDTIEPIAFLKEYLTNPRAQIFLSEKELVFKSDDTTAPLKLPADIPTAWKRQGAGTTSYYSLGQLWLAASNKGLKQQDFAKIFKELSLPVVQIMDRKAIEEYFSGPSLFSDEIDERVRPETMIKRATIKAGKVSVLTGQELIKRREAKAEEKKEHRAKRVSEIVLENEKKIAGKTTCLQSQGRSFLQVLQLAYKLTGNEERAKEVQERIEKRAQVAKNSGSGQSQIVRIDLNILGKRNLKKRSLLEEILKTSKGNAGKFICSQLFFRLR